MKSNFKVVFLLIVIGFNVHASPPPQTMACIGCHGMYGNPFVDTFPKLASLPSKYIVQQLKAFQSGERSNPLMSNVSFGLKEQDLKEIGDFYEAQKINPISSKLPIAKKALLELGSKLYNNGNPDTGQAACFACHGNASKPVLTKIGVPGLRSQSPSYLFQELLEFKKRTRTTGRERVMRRISDTMSVDQMEAVAYYASQMDNFDLISKRQARLNKYLALKDE